MTPTVVKMEPKSEGILTPRKKKPKPGRRSTNDR